MVGRGSCYDVFAQELECHFPSSTRCCHLSWGHTCFWALCYEQRRVRVPCTFQFPSSQYSCPSALGTMPTTVDLHRSSDAATRCPFTSFREIQMSGTYIISYLVILILTCSQLRNILVIFRGCSTFFHRVFWTIKPGHYHCRPRVHSN